MFVVFLSCNRVLCPDIPPRRTNYPQSRDASTKSSNAAVPLPRAISTLKALTISTGLFVKGSLLRNWLLSSIKASQLVRLTLLDTMQQIDFAVILGGLRLPRLTAFVIDSNKTKLDTLLAFLTANPNVADLSVLLLKGLGWLPLLQSQSQMQGP